jgi:hypothetical protein
MRALVVAVASSIVLLSGNARSQSGPATTTVRMQEQGGTYVVPVVINNAIKLDFIVDSGAADVSIPADVVLTLLRTGTIQKLDFIGERTYTLADGSTVPSLRFRLRSLTVGDKVLENVIASLAPVRGSLLLGQSFLSRFQSWSINNTSHQLILNGCCNSGDAQIASIPGAHEPLAITPDAAASTTAVPDLNSALQNYTRQFIFALYRQISSSNDQAMATLISIYADNVNYFGKDLTRIQVIEREAKFLDRWPVRQYKPKDGRVFVNCDPSTFICSANGVLQFDARSIERNQRSVGEATFAYRLQFSSPYQNTPKVILENGLVLKRTVQVLSPMAYQRK